MYQTNQEGINRNTQMLQLMGQNANKLISQISGNVANVSLRFDAWLEYNKKYWILPIGCWPGNKIFDKIIKKKVEEFYAVQEQRMQQKEDKSKDVAPSGTLPDEK